MDVGEDSCRVGKAVADGLGDFEQLGISIRKGPPHIETCVISLGPEGGKFIPGSLIEHISKVQVSF